jgi:hypothetical protein
MEQVFEIDTMVGSVQQTVKGTKTPYEVVLTGGVDKITGTPVEADAFVDWKKTVGPQAIGLQNQQASARVKIKYVPRQDGDGFWENKEVLAIAPLGMLPPAGQPVPGGVPAQAVPPQPMVPQPVMPAQQPQAAPQQAPPVPQAPPAVTELMNKQALSEAQRTRQGIIRAATEYVGAQAKAGMFDGSTDCDAALKARILDLGNYVTTGSFNSNEAEVISEIEKIATEVPGVQVGAEGIESPGVPFDTTEGGEGAA